MDDKEILLKKLADNVLEMEDEAVVDTANEYISSGYDALDGILNGLVVGMNKAGELYDEQEYFVTDLLLCSDAMYEGLNVLRPHLKNDVDIKTRPKVVIGVVEGDTHDIGKNIVKIMLDTAGFDMCDLGKDVPLQDFVEKAEEIGASIICMSTLMTTTMSGMKTVIEILKEKGIREKYKVMIGGSPISQKYCDEIGADIYTTNAIEAVKAAKIAVGVS